MFHNTFFLPLALLCLGVQYVIAAPIDLRRFDCNSLSTVRGGGGAASPANVGARASLADCLPSKREPEPEPEPQPIVIAEPQHEEEEDDLEKRLNCDISNTRFGSSAAGPADVSGNIGKRASLADCLRRREAMEAEAKREPAPEPKILSETKPAVEEVPEEEDEEGPHFEDNVDVKRFDCNELATVRTGSGGTSPSSAKDRRASLADCLRRREAVLTLRSRVKRED